MVQKMASGSMFPEELYNLTQLADVTLAAGKLNTTNVNTIGEHINHGSSDVKMDHKGMQQQCSDASTLRTIKSVEQKLRAKLVDQQRAADDDDDNETNNDSTTTNNAAMDNNKAKKNSMAIKHSGGENKSDRKSFNGAFVRSSFDQRQSSFSSSEDDSTYNYSHKIFDKRKSRKLQYQSDDSIAIRNQNELTDMDTFISSNVTETEDSMISNSETESSYNDDYPMRDKHSDSNGSHDDDHACPECGKKYSTSSNLARHRQTHRSLLDKKARRCPHCDKVYVSMPAFSMHVRTHNQGCECPHCGKRFSRPWLLQGHIRTHTGEKPFQCSICTKAFADKSNLRAHVQTHSNTKPHTCARCGKAFALKSYLYKHEESSCMRNHSKPSKCRIEPGSPKVKKVKRSNSAAAKASKKDNDDDDDAINMDTDAATDDNQECISIDSGSKKSYIDLSKIKTENDQYSRMSVIRTIVAPATNNFEQYEEFYQEKPVDFSPKNKYKTECTNSTIMDISRNYTATMVV